MERVGASRGRGGAGGGVRSVARACSAAEIEGAASGRRPGKASGRCSADMGPGRERTGTSRARWGVGRALRQGPVLAIGPRGRGVRDGELLRLSAHALAQPPAAGAGRRSRLLVLSTVPTRRSVQHLGTGARPRLPSEGSVQDLFRQFPRGSCRGGPYTGLTAVALRHRLRQRRLVPETRPAGAGSGDHAVCRIATTRSVAAGPRAGTRRIRGDDERALAAIEGGPSYTRLPELEADARHRSSGSPPARTTARPADRSPRPPRTWATTRSGHRTRGPPLARATSSG